MRWLSYIGARLVGWQFRGVRPPDPKFIVVAAPHTSNWDFILFLGAMWHWELKRVRFLAWEGVFRWPIARFLRWIGGIPVQPDRPRSVMTTAAAAFDAAESMILVITPESARRRREYWRSGFYRIARAADVPVLLAAVDGAAKQVVLGPLLTMTGDRAADMDRIRAYYGSVITSPPEEMGPIRLRDESPDRPPPPTPGP